MEHLKFTPEDNKFLTKELTLKSSGSKLEAFDSYDIQPEDTGKIYIPSSDILFIKEICEDQVRVLAYNIEYGIWTDSNWMKENQYTSENKSLLFQAFIHNIDAMIDKIVWAITKNHLDSLFEGGEPFQPTIRGINTKLQTNKELRRFKAKIIDSKLFDEFKDTDEQLRYIIDETLKETKAKFFVKKLS